MNWRDMPPRTALRIFAAAAEHGSLERQLGTTLVQRTRDTGGKPLRGATETRPD
jgi:hypothetical protein